MLQFQWQIANFKMREGNNPVCRYCTVQGICNLLTQDVSAG